MKKALKPASKIAPILLMLLFSACYYDEARDETIPDSIVVSFSLDIQPIFNTNCTSCHPVLVSPPDLSEDNSYDAITNDTYIVAEDLEASVLYQRLLGNPNIMPPNGTLPTSEINLIKKWIEQGALNN